MHRKGSFDKAKICIPVYRGMQYHNSSMDNLWLKFLIKEGLLIWTILRDWQTKNLAVVDVALQFIDPIIELCFSYGQ